MEFDTKIKIILRDDLKPGSGGDRNSRTKEPVGQNYQGNIDAQMNRRALA